MVRIPSTPSTIFHDLIDLHDLSLNCENKQKNLNFKKLAKFGHFYINLPAFQEQTYIANVQCFFKKWANPGLFFVYFRLFKQTLQFLQQINVKNVHPVYSAGIRTLNLQNMSLHP